LPPPPIPPGVPTSFESDTAISYEVGIKTDLLDGDLLLDADLFFIEWSNIQLLIFVPGFGGVNGNGETAETKGFEFAAAWAATEDLTISATAAYIDAYLTADTDPIAVGAVDGDPLPFIPDWSGAISADYRLPSTGTIDPFIGATWRYIGERAADFTTGAAGQVPIDSYDVLDLRVGFDREEWTLELYAKNVTDERGIVGFTGQNFSAAALGTANISVTTPRTIGIALTGRF
jgi:outer membrane receptor protein involved in Fe transport